MGHRSQWAPIATIGCTALALVAAPAAAQSVTAVEAAPADLAALRQQIEGQARQLEALRRSLAQQEAALAETRRALGNAALAAQRGAGQTDGRPDEPRQVAQAPVPVPAAAAAAQAAAAGGGTADASRRQEMAPIFEQPGVLTPRGKVVLEPSLQYAYSSSNRIALVGYTVIPSLLIGLIDIREVRRTTVTAALAGRFGITNRLEVEAKVPFVYRSDTGIGREILQGTASDAKIFDSTGKGLGDIELTGRYQINSGGMNRPYYVGSLRFKSRTGTDPFEVLTSKTIEGFRNDGVQTELPTGSGFYGLQPALTVLYPSDPAVFFGTVSYLHTFSRDNVTRKVDTGTGSEMLGKVSPGGIFGFNFGMGLGLNEKSSFSIGYDHASVGRTRVEGRSAADSARVQLGTMLLGYSYRLNDRRMLNVSLGAGLTRDTPDVTLTVRMPITF